LPVVVPVESDEELIPDPVPEPVAMMVARAINAELSFAGVQWQHMVLRMDNENTLQALWNRAGKEAFWVNWLTLEKSLGKKLRLGGLLFKVSDHAYGKNASATPPGSRTPPHPVQSADSGAPSRQDNVVERPISLDLKPPEAFVPGEPQGDLIERGMGDRDLDDEEMDDYSPDQEDVLPEETPPEGPPVGENEAPPEFDVDMQPAEDDDPMDVAISWLQDHALYALCSKPEVVRAAKGSEEPSNKALEFTLKFGGSKVKVQVASGAADEYAGELLDEKKLGEGMKLEMEELDNFGVCQVVSEKEAV
ncbi:unnamed protein product, partial [Symbiodinium sp. CCMP2456]